MNKATVDGEPEVFVKKNLTATLARGGYFFFVTDITRFMIDTIIVIIKNNIIVLFCQ